ncbi:MAG: NADH-quinone oxidoreductase subunit L [Chloroflexi bacterium]|nr:NADH-quinone oxidoreductase subunit L [Chloroflexota bacterium]
MEVLNASPGWMTLAWLAPAVCAAAFLAIVAFRRVLPREGAYISVLAIAFGFVLFWLVLVDFLGWDFSERGAFSRAITWLRVDDTRLTWGILIDPLTVVMLGLVTFVALLVQVYSLGYMAHEPRFGWYFAVHSLFAAAMLGLVLADNFLFLYIMWELVGLCSYLLIGFYYERRSAAEAAKKAFITTRIGDVGLLIGIIFLFRETGTFEMSAIFHAAEAGELSKGLLLAAALLIFLGAMGKSAQFPLHVWLPDAMEGPTPVSALIHAATMVVAGVYLVARAYPLFLAAPPALLIVAVIGLVTALLAATMALVMTDLKRVLAYSTVAHLGFMMLALGAGGFTAGIFHLLTHGFSKALVFLGAGSVSHGTGGKTDIREMGGLRHRMPITFLTFSIGALALGGVAPLSGFFSKDEVLQAVLGGRSPVFFIAALVVAFLSGLYMARVWFLVFFGPLKNENAHAHEAPWVMALPLLALAFLGATAGLLAIPWGGSYKGLGSFLYHGQPEVAHFNPALMVASMALALGAFGVGYLVYGRGAISPARLRERFQWLHRLVANKYYMDEVYQWCINRIVLAFSNLLALFDRLVVNDVGVNGTARSVVMSGYKLRLHVTGKLYNYALVMVLGVILVALLWWVAVPRP